MINRHGRCELFYSTLDALLTYANQQLQLSTLSAVSMRGSDKRLLGEASRVLDALWAHRELIETFVSQNPLELDDAQLAVARPWRYALQDAFTCIDAQQDYAIYLNEHRMFVVRGLRATADAYLRKIPCRVALTLLPFDGDIVTDTRIMHLNDEMTSDELGVLIECLERATAYGAIETSDQLVTYVRDERGTG